MASLCSLFFSSIVVIIAFMVPTRAQLNPNFYDKVCPKALPAIRVVVGQAVAQEPRMGASLLRLHFHDCFVNGCDGSILLDDMANFTGEKTAGPNLNSVRGFDVVDRIKSAVDSACHGSVVSCADILAVAARDSIVALGGRSYDVQVGRRDSRTASKAAAANSIPSPTFNISALLSNFQSHGLSLKDLVVLSGGHTIGQARCTTFRTRLYSETTIDASLKSTLQGSCPSSGGDNNLSPLDGYSPAGFDAAYFKGLMQKRGLLHSDQQLFKGDGSGGDALVRHYSDNQDAFWADFGASMLKMGNMSPLTGSNGEIRRNCRKMN